MIMPIVDDICPRLYRIDIVPLHELDNVLNGFNLVLAYNYALRFVLVTGRIVPLALSNLVDLKTSFWIYVQNVSDNLFRIS